MTLSIFPPFSAHTDTHLDNSSVCIWWSTRKNAVYPKTGWPPIHHGIEEIYPWQPKKEKSVYHRNPTLTFYQPQKMGKQNRDFHPNIHHPCICDVLFFWPFRKLYISTKNTWPWWFNSWLSYFPGKGHQQPLSLGHVNSPSRVQVTSRIARSRNSP